MPLSLTSKMVLAFTIGLADALALPNPPHVSRGGLLTPPKGKIELTSFPRQHTRSIGEQIHDELSYVSSKYGVSLQPGTLIPRAAGPGSSNPTVPVKGNAAYSIQFNIGGQNVNLDPDTGSNVLWMPTYQIAGNRTAPYSWNATASTTSTFLPNSNWSIAYYSSTSNVGGQVYNDNIYWNTAGASATLKNASIFLATQSGSTQSGGILGLDHQMTAGYSVNGTAKSTPSFFQQLIPTLQQPLFTVDFKHGANGTLNFGYIDSSKYNGSIQYLPVPDGQPWQSNATGYSIVGGASNATRSWTFVVDTGSSLMYMSKDIVTQYWSRINGSFFGSNGLWQFPCSQASTLPDFKVNINGKPAVTPGRYFNYGALANGTCYGGLQNNFLPNDVALWGAVWIKSQFLVFTNATSSTPATIGIANKTLTT